MSADWTAFGVANALRIAVAARSGITSLTPAVRVVSYLPSPDEQMPDAIVIGYLAYDAEEPARVAMKPTPRIEEVVGLTSRVQVTRAGAGQEVADNVRTRARALLAEVDAEVRVSLPDQGDQSYAGKVVEREMAVIATNRGDVGALVCAIDFTIQYKARTS